MRSISALVCVPRAAMPLRWYLIRERTPHPATYCSARARLAARLATLHAQALTHVSARHLSSAPCSVATHRVQSAIWNAVGRSGAGLVESPTGQALLAAGTRR